MTSSDYSFSKDLLWDKEISPKITSDPDLSLKLGNLLKEMNVVVASVERKHKSSSKALFFNVKTRKIKNLDIQFMTEEDANAWHKAKKKSFSTLTKAPDVAFLPTVETEEVDVQLYWNQAYNLAHRLVISNLESKNSKENVENLITFNEITDSIMRFRGTKIGSKYGI